MTERKTIYTQNQYSNVPRNPVEKYRYLRGSNPQTEFPYDAAYDPTYQYDTVFPQYKYFKHHEYPSWVQEHNPPHVFAQSFVDPKPRSITIANNNNESVEYSVNEYPPYSYFYPNPLECEDVCGQKICNNYYKKRNDYYNCKRCQLIQSPGPMCWNSNLQKCVKCPKEKALEPCENKFGCANANGFPHNRVEPINPKYTGCANCL